MSSVCLCLQLFSLLVDFCAFVCVGLCICLHPSVADAVSWGEISHYTAASSGVLLGLLICFALFRIKNSVIKIWWEEKESDL